MKKMITAGIKFPGLALVFLLIFHSISYSQVKYTTEGAKIQIAGTSNIHDWTMNSSSASCSGTFTLGSNNAITAVSGLSFSIKVESLKSEHKAMDKNTYKAMNTDKNPNISFTAGSATIKPEGSGYTVTAHGKLTINGNSKDADVVATCTVNADKSITCTGTYKLKMTEYKVTPPSIMFGMIKVGDPITVNYNFTLK